MSDPLLKKGVGSGISLVFKEWARLGVEVHKMTGPGFEPGTSPFLEGRSNR